MVANSGITNQAISHLTARHASCSWRGEQSSGRRKPPAGLPHHGLNPASAQKAAPWLRASGHHRSLLHRRRCATAPASGRAARRFAACRRLPCRVLHHARGCATGFVSPAIAVPPAPTFAPARRLRRQLRSRLRRLPQGWLARCARLHQGRSGVNAPLRYAFNITAHYPKPLRLPQQSCSRLGPLHALRVRVMVCYVLRPRSSQVRHSALRDGWLTFNRSAALPRLTARSLAGCAGQSVGGCRAATTDFWFSLSMSVYWPTCQVRPAQPP